MNKNIENGLGWLDQAETDVKKEDVGGILV